MGKIVAIGGGFDGKYANFLVRHILSLSGIPVHTDKITVEEAVEEIKRVLM